jgi:sec-independent protein translocase protein TatC
MADPTTPDPEQVPADEFETDEKDMGFFDHLEELRWHIIRAGIGVIVAICVTTYFADWIINSIVLRPARMTDPPLVLVNAIPYGQITFYMTTIVMSALMISVPYILYEAWSFVKPGLYPRERKHFSSIVGYTTLCFGAGVAFAYFLMLPFFLQFFARFGYSGIQNLISVSEYVDFVTWLVLVCGVIFEMPMVAYFLARLGILTPAFLRHYRRHAIIVILFIAAFATPTTDPLTMVIFAMPMFILYEVSIWVSKVAVRKRDEARAENS